MHSLRSEIDNVRVAVLCIVINQSVIGTATCWVPLSKLYVSNPENVLDF